MKKLVLALIVLGGLSISAHAQSGGDLFVGGNSNLGITITPDFNLNGNVMVDYFIKDDLSVGGNLGFGIGSATSMSLAPSVKYFFMGDVFAMVGADVLYIEGGTTTIGLNSLNAGVGFWLALADNVVVTPTLNLSDLTNTLSISMGISVKF